MRRIEDIMIGSNDFPIYTAEDAEEFENMHVPPLSHSTNIKGVSYEVKEDKVLKFAEDIAKFFKDRPIDEIKCVQFTEPALENLKKLVDNYVKQNKKRR